MLSASFDMKSFDSDMKNIIQYSIGFLDGVERAKPAFIKHVGEIIKDRLNDFIDSNARVNPQALNHVYEWYQTGSPDARLFNITYATSNTGLSFASTYSQSMTVKNGSKVPFYDKARIMEEGIPVTITPTNKLVFDVDGKTVFTSKPVTVENPGGDVQGEYKKVLDMFFNGYLKQSLLNESGILMPLKKNAFADKFPSAKRGGRSLGLETGYNWLEGVGK